MAINLRAIVDNAREQPWLPGVASVLAQEAHSTLLAPRGLSAYTYGTQRYLEGSAAADRDQIFLVPVASSLPVIGEWLPGGTFKKYEHLGLSQINKNNETVARVRETVARAFTYFQIDEPLSRTIGQLVRCIHILASKNDTYDVSHSDPTVPFSIFISVPQASTPQCYVRVAESILHESMHLQLSLIEDAVTLVSHEKPIRHSPWRGDRRPPGAVLHGIYVFVCIMRFLELLCNSYSTSGVIDYAHRRNKQIRRELNLAFLSLKSSDLTELGGILIDLLKYQARWPYL